MRFIVYTRVECTNVLYLVLECPNGSAAGKFVRRGDCGHGHTPDEVFCSSFTELPPDWAPTWARISKIRPSFLWIKGLSSWNLTLIKQ